MIQAEIDLGILRGNLERLRGYLQGCALMFVVKEDAYGHGLSHVAWAAEGIADWFGVADVAEARALRRAGFSEPIFIMLPPVSNYLAQAIREGFHFPIGDTGMVDEVPKIAREVGRPALVHLEVDTGMGRFGLLPEEACAALPILSRSPHVQLMGIYSHLSSSHGASQDDVAFTRAQVWHFRKLVEDWFLAGFDIPWRHLANSGAALGFPEGIAPPLNMVRIGTAAYGYPTGPLSPPVPLRPVAKVWTEVVAVRDLPQGWPVGYERRYVTEAPERIAILAAGYSDGLRPELGRVAIHGREVPLLGKIGMDTAAADVTDLSGVRRGDRADLFGPNLNGLPGWACPVLVPVLLSAHRRWVSTLAKSKPLLTNFQTQR